MIEHITELISLQLQNNKKQNSIVHNSQMKVGRKSTFYNEGWMLKLVLKWYYDNKKVFTKNGKDIIRFHNKEWSWFTEAQLSNPFLTSKDSREGYTNADAVIGDFWFSKSAKIELATTNQTSTKLITFEAKIGSDLSTTISNAKAYNQATRNIVCMISMAIDAKMNVTKEHPLEFYVISSSQQTKIKNVKYHLNKEVLADGIIDRFKNQGKVDYKEYLNYLNTGKIRVGSITWEEIILDIYKHDKFYAKELLEFYLECIAVSNKLKAHRDSIKNMLPE